MSEFVRSEELRARVLDHWAASADVRAREVLERAVVAVEHGVRAWQGTPGAVHAHRVILLVEPRDLALTHSVPSVYDTICAAIAGGVASHPGETLAELAIRWRVAEDLHADGYRGAVISRARHDDPSVLRHALVEYLKTSGELEAASRIERSRLEIARDRLMVHTDADDRVYFDADAHRLAVVQGAVNTLMEGLEGPMRVRITDL